MNRRTRALTSLAILALAACQVGPLQTPSPDPSVPPTDEPTKEPSPPATPSHGPTSTEIAPTPTEIAPTPTALPGDLWNDLPGFEPGSIVNDALGYGDGRFNVVGVSVADRFECKSAGDARIWETYQERAYAAPIDKPTHGFLNSVVIASYGISPWYALGGTGSPGCYDGEPIIWGRSDKSDWYRLTPSGLNGATEIVDAVAVDDHIVATGSNPLSDERMGIWLSEEGQWAPQRWHHAADAPTTEYGYAFTSLVALGSTVVGFDSYLVQPAWYSSDGGESWQHSDFTPQFDLAVTSVVSGDGRIVAVGEACCTDLETSVGIALVSVDGRTWQLSSPLPTVPQAIAYVRNRGFVAVGAQTFVSEDGLAWFDGPDVPGHHEGEHLTLAADQTAIMAAGETRAWSASASILDPSMWTAPVALVERPIVGASSPYSIFSVCGPQEVVIHFDLRSWVPDPNDLVDGEFPPGLTSEDDLRGTLRYVEPDRLEFANDHGQTIDYLPTDAPPQSHPCA